MNTFKQEVAVRRPRWTGRAGRDWRRASGVGQPRRPRPGADLSVLHGAYGTDGSRWLRRRLQLAAVGRQLDGSAKAVKVRFLEGKNSREVLDFNLYLSAKDVWTAAIIPTTDGAGIFTRGQVLHEPDGFVSSASPTAFVNFAYTGSNDDKARTRRSTVRVRATSKSSKWAT